MALRTLTVDLERGHARQQLPAAVERDYLGGRGAIAWLLWHHLPPDTPPMAAENLLVFAAGPLAGTPTFATGGFTVGTRSPLTGAIGYGWAQGHWGATLRRAGHDMLIVRGQAPDWCYLQIDRDQVRLRPAAHLMGKDTVETSRAIQAELGEDFAVVCLGPAGEAEVAYASIVAEGRYMAEPAGAGIVMASKRLKAIAVRGGPELPAPDPRRLAVAQEIVRRRVDASPLAASIRKQGSLAMLGQAAEWGALTSHNGREALPEDALAATRSALTARRLESRGCHACPMPCYFDTPLRPGASAPLPELEHVAGFAARCGVTSPEALLAIADRCLRLGIDPAGASAAVAFLMECQEEGLNQSGTLPWGDDEAIIAALERIAVRQERRDMLSLGVGEIADVFWGGAAFAPQIKGLGMPGLDPRALTQVALALATSPIGGDYRYAMPYEELIEEPPSWLPDEPSHPQAVKGKVLRLIWHERFAAVLDSAGICRRLGLMGYQISPGELLAMIGAATGLTVNGADMARIGERIVTVERLFARRYADNGGRDELPARWAEEPLEDGRAAGHLPRLADLLAEYYRRHGWSAEGQPTPERLSELGIKG